MVDEARGDRFQQTSIVIKLHFQDHSEEMVLGNRSTSQQVLLPPGMFSQEDKS